MKAKTKFRFRSSLFIVVTIFLITSCSVEKRLYRPGFHFQRHCVYSSSNSNSENEVNEVADTVIQVKENKRVLAKNLSEHKPIQLKELKNKPIESSLVLHSNLHVYDLEMDEEEEAEVETIETVTEEKDQETIKTKDESSKSGFTLRKIAQIIGISILLMTVVSGLAAPITNSQFVLGNSMLTGLNVVNNFSKFKSSVLGWIVILILDLIVSGGFLKYYKEENPKLGVLSGVLRFLYSLFLGAAIVQLLQVHPSSSSGFIYERMKSFYDIWGIGLIVFGFHLIALGLLFKNEGGKKWVTILIKSLLIFSGIGYILQYAGVLLVANPVAFAAAIEPIFIIPMILSEFFLALWMIIKGGKKEAIKNI